MHKVLLIEDNDLNRDMLSRRLRRRAYIVIAANDAAEGISLAVREQPDLILMDIGLPDMNGWDATRRIREDARTSAIPVIALTAHAMAGDRERTIEAGCNEYETKPVDFSSLLGKMEALLTPAAAADGMAKNA